jgi:AcrR family transcriptional regulator
MGRWAGTVRSVASERRRTEAGGDRDDRRAERRTQLLDAAVAAIREHGPAITMEQLANAGGVTKPILYRHFGDRDGLIQAIAERFSNDLLTSVTTPLGSTSDARDLLRSTVDSYVSFIERDPNLYRFMVQHPLDRPDGASGMGSLVDLIARQVAQVAGERLRAAGRDSGAAVPWAYGIVGLVHQAGEWWVTDQTMSRETLVDYLVSLLWDGLGGAQGGAAPPA